MDFGSGNVQVIPAVKADLEVVIVPLPLQDTATLPVLFNEPLLGDIMGFRSRRSSCAPLKAGVVRRHLEDVGQAFGEPGDRGRSGVQ